MNWKQKIACLREEIHSETPEIDRKQILKEARILPAEGIVRQFRGVQYALCSGIALLLLLLLIPLMQNNFTDKAGPESDFPNEDQNTENPRNNDPEEATSLMETYARAALRLTAFVEEAETEAVIENSTPLLANDSLIRLSNYGTALTLFTGSASFTQSGKRFYYRTDTKSEPMFRLDFTAIAEPIAGFTAEYQNQTYPITAKQENDSVILTYRSGNRMYRITENQENLVFETFIDGILREETQLMVLKTGELISFDLEMNIPKHPDYHARYHGLQNPDGSFSLQYQLYVPASIPGTESDDYSNPDEHGSAVIVFTSGKTEITITKSGISYELTLTR